MADFFAADPNWGAMPLDSPPPRARSNWDDFRPPGRLPTPDPERDAPPSEDLDEPEDTSVVGRLFRCWMTERCSPDVMPFEGDLVQRVMNQLEAQSKLISVLRVDGASEEDHEKIGLVQLEMERVTFVLRSYIVTRQEKLIKYAHFINATPEMQTRLSMGEQALIESHQQIFDESLIRDVVGNLPEELQALDEELPDGRSMISRPDLNRAVFIRAKQNCAPILLSDGSSIEIKNRAIHLIPYRAVEQLVLRGEVELI